MCRYGISRQRHVRPQLLPVVLALLHCTEDLVGYPNAAELPSCTPLPPPPEASHSREPCADAVVIMGGAVMDDVQINPAINCVML